MDEITELTNKHYENEKTIERLKYENRQIIDKIILLQWCVSPGVIVKGKDDRLYKVANVEFHGFKYKPWILGNPQKKDGSFGTAERHLYSDWELVEANK